MKNQIIIGCILWCIGCIITSAIVCLGYQSHKEAKLEHEIKCYEAYVAGAEELLDTLENAYNWVDAYDVDAYYEGIAILNEEL